MQPNLIMSIFPWDCHMCKFANIYIQVWYYWLFVGSPCAMMD